MIKQILSITLFALILIQYSNADNLHMPWDRLLHAYVKGGVVQYTALKNRPEDLVKFNGYLGALAKQDISRYSRDEQLAFWINAYNAFTVKLILNHYPLKSIKDIKKPWNQKIWKAGGETISLDIIEHKKLREDLKEPRIHFAIVCASIGCPHLDNKAFLSETVQKHLDERARSFFTHQNNFRLQNKNNMITIRISKIFKWFGGDFGKSDDEKLMFIRKFLAPKDAEDIKHAKKVKLQYLPYDWSLNGK